MVHAPRLSALCCGLLAFCSVFALKARADSFTQSGVFTDDNQVLQIPFSSTTTQNYTFSTTSYASGGFDPVLTLFTSAGTILPGNANSAGGADAFLTDVLGPGSYILTLTEFPNFSNGTITGATGFTTGAAPSASFIDLVTGNPTTANYTVNYTSSAVSSVTPEPPTALLLLLPLGGVVVLNRRRLQASASL